MTRADGRAIDQLRPVELTKDYIKFAEGSMEYSAVTQPCPSGTWGGVFSSTEALHSTTVSPQRISTLPSANFI